jgi:hypothetical protein
MIIGKSYVHFMNDNSDAEPTYYHVRPIFSARPGLKQIIGYSSISSFYTLCHRVGKGIENFGFSFIHNFQLNNSDKLIRFFSIITHAHHFLS